MLQSCKPVACNSTEEATIRCADLEGGYVVVPIAIAGVILPQQGEAEGAHIDTNISCCAGQVIDGGPCNAAVCKEWQRLGESLP